MTVRLSPGGGIQVESSVSGHNNSEPLYPSTTTIPHAFEIHSQPKSYIWQEEQQHKTHMEGLCGRILHVWTLQWSLDLCQQQKHNNLFRTDNQVEGKALNLVRETNNMMLTYVRGGMKIALSPFSISCLRIPTAKHARFQHGLSWVYCSECASPSSQAEEWWDRRNPLLHHCWSSPTHPQYLSFTKIMVALMVSFCQCFQ